MSEIQPYGYDTPDVIPEVCTPRAVPTREQGPLHAAGQLHTATYRSNALHTGTTEESAQRPPHIIRAAQKTDEPP